MSRFADAYSQNAVKQMVVHPALFFDFNFPSGHIRLSTATRSMQIDGNLFYGIGDAFNSQNAGRSVIGNISPITESVNGEVNTVEVSLSGVPSELITLALEENYINRYCDIYIAFLNADDELPSGQVATLIRRMLVESMPIKYSKATSAIAVTLKSRIVNWQKPVVRLSTNADQQARYAGDLSHSLVQLSASRKVIWKG